MFDVNLGNEYIVDADGTSEGTQLKFYKDGYWYKSDFYGGEGFAEKAVTILLECSSLTAEEFVHYDRGIINGKTGCRSKNFLAFGESFITLYRFYQLTTGQKLNEDILHFDTPEERADFVIRFFKEKTHVDLTGYFSKIFTLDRIILNEDRHFNNLGIVQNTDGTYRPAPIFDNGKSLLVGNVSVNRHLPISENVKRTIAKPFSGSYDKNFALFGAGFTLDFDACLRRIDAEPGGMEKDVLLHQLNTFASGRRE